MGTLLRNYPLRSAKLEATKYRRIIFHALSFERCSIDGIFIEDGIKYHCARNKIALGTKNNAASEVKRVDLNHILLLPKYSCY